MLEGVKVALDPSLRQEGLLLSHAGAAWCRLEPLRAASLVERQQEFACAVVGRELEGGILQRP